LVWCGLVGPRRGLGSEASLRRRRGPARLWVAVAALVVGTMCLFSSSSVDLFGASYRVQVRSPRPRLLSGLYFSVFRLLYALRGVGAKAETALACLSRSCSLISNLGALCIGLVRCMLHCVSKLLEASLMNADWHIGYKKSASLVKIKSDESCIDS
jgi:hypothetical protein